MGTRALRAVLAGAALLLLARPSGAELRSIALAARASHDVGTVFVSGTESGPGALFPVRFGR